MVVRATVCPGTPESIGCILAVRAATLARAWVHLTPRLGTLLKASLREEKVLYTYAC